MFAGENTNKVFIIYIFHICMFLSITFRHQILSLSTSLLQQLSTYCSMSFQLYFQTNKFVFLTIMINLSILFLSSFLTYHLLVFSRGPQIPFRLWFKICHHYFPIKVMVLLPIISKLASFHFVVITKSLHFLSLLRFD